MTRSGLRWRVVVALVVSALAAFGGACEGGGGGGDDGGGGSSDGGGGSSGGGTNTVAEAGEQQDEPITDPGSNLGGTGSLGGPPPPQGVWSAQDAANAVLATGVSFDDGTEHQPGYVQCAGDEATASDDGAKFSEFDCLVEVPGVAPYRIDLTVTEDAAKVSFNGLAD
jgi:hypothetical protein